MKNKGFTLVELLVVIAILAIASGLIATNFFGLLDKNNDFEDEVLGKSIAEAAYVFYDSKDNPGYSGCRPISDLISSGYISDDQGLLKKYSSSELSTFYYKAYKTSGEKKAEAYRNTGSCNGDDCCTNANTKKLYTY